MALPLRRNRWMFRLTSIFLILLLLQLMIYFCQNAFDDGIYEELNLHFLNKTSDDYQFIKTYFLNATEGSWQYVSDPTETGNKFLAFSAFLDNRFEEKSVKVIAVETTKRKLRSKNVYCKFWYKKNNGQAHHYTSTTTGVHKLVSEHWGLPYSAYYILCRIDQNLPVPNAVSLLINKGDVPKNIFKVIENFEKPPEWNIEHLPLTYKNLAVCVKPLHYEYNKVMELLEFIELNRIMGVDHFFFYNHTVGYQVNCLLKNYINDGIVTMLPWNLPLVSQKEIRTEGIFAALNDCLFRTMHLYSHAMFIDFDEFIIPTNNFTYKEFFRHLDAHENTIMKAAFLFQNAFFYRQWADDPEVNNFNDPLAANLLVLKKTTRKKGLHKHRTRSKYIVRPELVNMVGNHFIWEYANKKFKSLNIGPNDAILHHYRVCEFGGDDCINQESVVDKTAYKYKDELIQAVRNRIEKHKTECHLNNSIYSS